jgi:hypothetical protein
MFFGHTNRMNAGRYYGNASICKNPYNTQCTCYMYSNSSRKFARNFIPTKANANGLRLLFNNNKFTLTSSAIGNVGTSASASRAIARGRASARNAAKVKFNRK